MHDNLPKDDDEMAQIAAQAVFNGAILLVLTFFLLGFAVGRLF
jgi:hypothetical protein